MLKHLPPGRLAAHRGSGVFSNWTCRPQLGVPRFATVIPSRGGDEDIASANGSLSYHRVVSGELWDAQTPASRPRGGAQGLRCVLQLDVSPTTWSAPICNGYSVKGWDEDIASANGSLSYHRVVSGELWDAQTTASRPRGRAQGLRCVLQLDVSPTTWSAPICNGYSVKGWDEDIASANGSLSYHRVVSGELWDAQTPASRPRGGAQGLRCVLQLDVSPTTWSAPICNGYSVKGWDEDIASANGSLSYHRVVSGELWDAQTPASRPRGGAQGLRCVLQLDVSPTTWSAPICNGYSVKGWDEDIASANGSLSYHRVVSGELWDAQTTASRPRGGAQGLRCVLQLDVSPTTRSAPICNGYSVKGWDEDIASANGSLSYHRVVSGELWDAQTPASRPRGGAQGLRCVLQLDVSPTSHNLECPDLQRLLRRGVG